ncbi:Endonuclease, Uma2 family (restriction endonuclease fold) [Desulfotomaculum arcticum]|uniref:Endonuclease, Uma2 family (Restriction endonuclease fold) n=1 Tax=Desulfotruncus arcticus DSM 17038 TaxID=1121424 RepID=A0A1I2QX32_9FIRM|nr:Uma2 family endonuclease [Desulfotruncus arcticus]SFG30256.1 Endonuclease, Uma2 family (restriction endonuclease fold) [Desulfotomaculum arcticum] [Desulfotruncus arcticus DSM 17038]
MQETPNKLYTYEDYLKINDDNQYELIGGELILVPSPKTGHQRISGRLYKILANFIDKNDLGELLYAPTDVVLSETEKPQPDILFISASRLDIIAEDNIKGAPDLVIEILSPSTTSRDRVGKSKMYYTHGVKEFWIVDPDAKVIEVFSPGEKNWNLVEAYGQDGVLTSSLLLGLQINLVNIF